MRKIILPTLLGLCCPGTAVYTLSGNSRVRLEIYTELGQRVASLADEVQRQGCIQRGSRRGSELGSSALFQTTIPFFGSSSVQPTLDQHTVGMEKDQRSGGQG